MALSAALHHSRGVGPELHEAPRGPKTDRAVEEEEEVREVNDALEGQKRPPPGVRPAPLPEVARPKGRLVADGYVAEIRCEGPGAWHPLDPSWVPLRVLRGRYNILGVGVRG